MEDSPVTTEAPSTAAADAADVSTLDLENMSLPQLDELLSTGQTVLPPKPGGEETIKETPPKAKVELPTGDKPPAAAPEAKKVEEVVVETRTPEEIETAVAAAAAEALAAGGDEAAIEAAAELARAPQAEPAAPVIEEPAGIERPRLKDERDQLIAGIYMKAKREGNSITWAEAESRVDGPPPAAKKVEEAAPPVNYTEIVGTLTSEVATLKAELEALNTEADEGLYKARLTTCAVELAEKTADLKLAIRDQKQATEQAAREAADTLKASETARTASKAEAATEWPDCAVKGSKLDLAVQAEIATLRNPKHPDHSILYADSAPYVIVSRVARREGIAPAARAASPSTAKPKVEAPPRKAMSPVPGSKTAVTSGQPVEAAKQTFEYLRDEASLAELDKFMGMPDPEKLLAGVVQ